MKKILSALLAMILFFSLAACQEETKKKSKEDKEKTNEFISKDNSDTSTEDTSTLIDPTREKIEGPFVFASEYSEGFAFVEKHSERGTVYCIDKAGGIVFKVENYMPDGVNHNPSADMIKFREGYTSILGNLYDYTGKKTTPEDVGATEFVFIGELSSVNGLVYYYNTPLPGGYILAKRKVSTYNSGEVQLGILNSKLEWQVEPSVEFYEAFNSFNSFNGKAMIVAGKYVYMGKENYYLNPEDGTIKNELPANCEFKSDLWIDMTNNSTEAWYSTSSDGEDVQLKLNNIYVRSSTLFIKGKAAILIYNAATKEYFLGVINEKGEFLFEPKNIGEEYCGLLFDGEHILTYKGEAKLYSITGELLSSISGAELPKGNSYEYRLSDNVIRIEASEGMYYFQHKVYYYSLDFDFMH